MPTTNAAGLSARRARESVKGVARRHFSQAPRRLVEHAGGLSNSVFGFRAADGDYVVRLHADATKIQDYYKEQWAMEQARAAGVPTPRVLEVGNEPGGLAYMITEKVDGVGAEACADRLGVLRQLGRLAARLHGVRTSGFGPVFDWSSNRLSRFAKWRPYLETALGIERRLEVLVRRRMLGDPQLGRLRQTLGEMLGWRKPAVLHHGDLRLKNVLVDPASGRIAALIDWEKCLSSPAPYWDLSIALHDLGIDEKEAFLGGYGLDAARYARIAPYVRAFNLVNYVDAIEQAVADGDRERLAWHRLRLQGDLDLYAG